MRQVTTPATMPVAQRNAIVVAANIRCHAIGCKRKATRWSNLCGLCERKFLEDLKPVFGKPTADQLAAARQIVRLQFAKQIADGVFDDWASQIGRQFARPISLLISPWALGRRRKPSERFKPLLALRTRDRGILTRRGVVNLLAYALTIDTLITPTIPQPVRWEYMIALLGQRFMGREVYSRTDTKIRTKRVSTGVIRYGPSGPHELTKMVEEEVAAKEFYRIRRADMRYIGRRLWKATEKMLLSGGREGAEWQRLKDKLHFELFGF